MSESTRPSMQSVQRSLFFGILIGLILGAIIGIVMAYVFVANNPPVYSGGAYPNELTNNYQSHYLAMTVDSYIVNPQPAVAVERLKTFSPGAQINVLGERSAAFVAAGRGAEAALVNDLAVALKGNQGWSDDEVMRVIGELSAKYKDDPARAQAINTFSAALLNGQVPMAVEPGAVLPAEQPAVPPPAQPSEGRSWTFYLLLCLLVVVFLLIVLYLLGRRQVKQRESWQKKEIEWEGEGPPPFRKWTFAYTLGQNTFDEFFTIETDENDFLGECGMGILEAVPGTDPKQVVSFDVGLFDKTDITTLSQVVMTEHAYNDEAIRAKVEANPQATAILAEPNKQFIFETSAMRAEARILDMALAEGNKYFDKLTVELALFLKEGADLKKGRMDIPDKFTE
ncbi:MAG: hypothetical protein Kow0031_01050 [Anaerolineae bacterium]